MSLKIPPLPAAEATTPPDQSVPLSQRVQARLPPRLPSLPDEVAVLPVSPQPGVPAPAQWPLQMEVALSPAQPRADADVALDVQRLTLTLLQPAAAGAGARAADAATRVRLATAAVTATTAAANAVALKGAVPVPPSADPGAVVSDAAGGNANEGGSAKVGAVAANAAPAQPLPGSRPAQASVVVAESPAPSHLASAATVPAVSAVAAPASDGLAPPQVPAHPSPAEHAVAADRPEAIAPAPVTASAPSDSGAHPDGQSLADARRAEANLGTRQHVRAVRQAEALQTAMATRADTGSQIHVAFNSWGAGHAVSGYLKEGRLHMQPTTARVGNALSSAVAPIDTELQIAVDVTDSATDERRRRRDGQGHA